MLTEDILKDLYQVKLMSIHKIAIHLGASRGSIDKAFKLYGIPLRSKQYQAYMQHGKIFNIKPKFTADDYILYGLGLGLYWGEGNKVDPYSVRLGNTDPLLVVAFVRFLKDICGIRQRDIKYGLQLFNDANETESLAYWMEMLNCERDSFHKTVSSIPPQGKGSYGRKNMHGVVQVYVSNKRFKEWMMAEIEKYAAIAQG